MSHYIFDPMSMVVSGTGLTTDTQVITTTSNWTKPANAKIIEVIVVGGGGGGGGGARTASGTAGVGGGGGGVRLK